MKSISFCVILLFISNSILAQFTLNRKINSFGISLESNMSFARINLSNEFIPTFGGTISNVENRSKPGFGLGINYQHRFNDKIGFKIDPKISFLETEVIFDLEGAFDRKFSRIKEYVLVEFPFGIIYENLAKKVSPTFMLGGNFGYDLTSDTNDPTALVSDENAFQISLEAGIGVAIAFKNFVLRPEVVFTKGLSEQERYLGVPSDSIDKNEMDRLSLRFSFYGL